MDLQTLIKDAKERFGFEEAGALNVEALEFLPEVRQMCAADRCRSFNRNCPARRDAARWKRLLSG